MSQPVPWDGTSLTINQEVIVRTLCEFIVELWNVPGRRATSNASEADAIRALYFSEDGQRFDPGLVERLLWWEGVPPPATSEKMRMRGEGVAA